MIAGAQVGERHPERVVLHLPDVAELVADEVVPCARGQLAQEDRAPGGVAVEAAQPREREGARDDQDAHARDRDRPGVQREPIEPCLGALEDLSLPC